MQGSIALRNEVRAMSETPPMEFMYTILADDTTERVTDDTTLFYQKAFIYPARLVGASGIITVNNNNLYVGKSGLAISFTPTSVLPQGSIAVITQAAHGLRAGMSVRLLGFTPAAYNVTKPIFDVTANTFKVQLASAPEQPSVLGTVDRLVFMPDLLVPTDLPIKYELPLGLKMRLADVIVQGKIGDGVLVQAW